MAQIAFGMVFVVLIVYLLSGWIASERDAHIPPGRMILRPPHDVNCLALIDDAIWAGGKDGLFVFASNGTALVTQEPLRSLRFVTALLREADGSVWIAHEDGMTHWKNAVARHFSTLAGSFPGRGLAVLRDRDGVLWAGSDRGLAKLVGDRFIPVVIPDEFLLTEVAVLFQDSVGALWLGDSSPRSPGLVRWDAEGFRLLTRHDGLPHQTTNTIINQGGSSRLWVGTGFAGLGAAVIFDGVTWQVVGRQQGLAGDKVRSIFEDTAGRLWFGSEYEGVAVFGDQRLAVIDEAGGLAGPEVKAILEYPQNTFWLGTNGGLTKISQFQPVAGDPRYPGFGGRSR